MILSQSSMPAETELDIPRRQRIPLRHRARRSMRSPSNNMHKLDNMLPFRTLFYAALAGLPLRVAAVQQYCSSQNTGASNSLVTWLYNSNGYCTNQCKANYAFAIVQYQNCWCSNYAPAAQEDVSNCNEACPGWPGDNCGNESNGLFGYIALSIAPSGTAGGSSSSSTPPPSSSSSSSAAAAATSSSTSSTPTPTTTITSSSSSTAPIIPIASTSSTSPSETPSPVTSIQVITVSGAAVTRTVTSTSTPTSAPNSSGDGIDVQRKQKGLSGGAIAGIVIGALAALALLLIAVVLFWRRKQNADAAGAHSNSAAKRHLGRNVSVLSRSGLLNRGRPSSMVEVSGGAGGHPADDAATGGHNSVRHSMLFAGGDGVHPESPLGSSHGTPHHGGSGSGGAAFGSASDDRPGSRPMVYDQRLNPSALFGQHDNGSRISMQDQQDYSRPLGIANPDPRASFDSRLSRID